MRNRIDHWCSVEQGNPNPRVHRSSGKLGEASFPTGTVDPRVGISLSPLNTNDGFSLSIPVNILLPDPKMESDTVVLHHAFGSKYCREPVIFIPEDGECCG